MVLNLPYGRLRAAVVTSMTQQFMIYHLYEWDTEKLKYKKKPVGLRGEPLAAGGGIATSTDRETVVGTINALNADSSHPQYRLGLWLAPGCGLFFLDLDEDAVAAGALTASAADFASELIAAGCYFEASSSGRGAHVIGRYSGELPPRTIQRPLSEPWPHALYTEGRGCVLSDVHAGSWDVDATLPLLRLVAKYFQPRVAAEGLQLVTDGPRAGWRGPADDDQLIARMLGASGSAVARLRGAVPLADLWAGRCEHNNESDMALASHLAFWTGCDPGRIERLMRRSPLAASRIDKWDTHRTYLRELTINTACATTTAVYVEPARVDTAASLLGLAVRPLVAPPATTVLPATSDWHVLVDQTISNINNAGTYRELHDIIMPALGAMGFPRSHGERIVTSLSRKLELFDAKLPLATLRALVMPPMDATQAFAATPVPEWAQNIVFNLSNDKYYDTSTGYEYTQVGLRVAFSRFMSMKATGTREDPVQWLSERWQITHVNDLEYRPDQPPIFQQGTRTIGNLFLLSSMPTPTFGTDECAVCINLFMNHLADITGRRVELYGALLGWIAHNVQHPGVKIRWAPLIKGVGGDGKSIIAEMMFAVMGEDNVKITSPSTIGNSGGFTDWASGRAVNFIEEIRLEGKERRKLYNAMKTIIGDGRHDINKKGRASGRTSKNVMNHGAFSNYGDAIPLDDSDRRWTIIFTPWETAEAAAKVKGLGSSDELQGYFERMGKSMRTEPGAWRSWLLGIDLSAFNPNSRAPMTQEREAMHNGSEDFIEQTVRDVIQNGGVGISTLAFCSASLMMRVQVAMNEAPDKRSWNRILTDIGYQQLKPMWWNGKTRRVWVKSAMTHDQVVEILNKSAFSTPL